MSLFPNRACALCHEAFPETYFALRPKTAKYNPGSRASVCKYCAKPDSRHTHIYIDEAQARVNEAKNQLFRIRNLVSGQFGTLDATALGALRAEAEIWKRELQTWEPVLVKRLQNQAAAARRLRDIALGYRATNDFRQGLDLLGAPGSDNAGAGNHTEPGPEFKRCNDCGETKELTEFHKISRGAGERYQPMTASARRPYCKKCDTERSRVWHEKQRQKKTKVCLGCGVRKLMSAYTSPKTGKPAAFKYCDLCRAKQEAATAYRMRVSRAKKEAAAKAQASKPVRTSHKVDASAKRTWFRQLGDDMWVRFEPHVERKFWKVDGNRAYITRDHVMDCYRIAWKTPKYDGARQIFHKVKFVDLQDAVEFAYRSEELVP